MKINYEIERFISNFIINFSKTFNELKIKKKVYLRIEPQTLE